MEPREKKILELALESDGLTVPIVCDKLDTNYPTALGILTDLLAKGYFRLVKVTSGYRTFIPVKEKIREALQER